MAISKVILNGVTQMDVTQDTVEANKLLSNETATKNDGTKVTGTIASKSSSDLTVSGATVTAPAGFYSSNASKSVASGSVTAPASISGTSATISTGVVGTTGLTLTKTVSVTPNVTTAGYISSGTAGNSSVSLAADIPVQGDISLTELSGTITAPAGYYPNNASRTVASGTAGTPTATKGTVSNNSVSVTPSVTNTTGYIIGNTITGTAVTVTASELVSGNLDITENGENIDVTNYATVSVDVAGGGASGLPGTWYQDEDGYIVISDRPAEADEKLINFIDYDGKILYSYTSAEWANVTALPDNPSHAGLTAEGWNWTKNQIDAQLLADSNSIIDVGQMYRTTSGATEIDFELDDPNSLSPYLYIKPGGTVTVDWGDGSSTETVTGTSVQAKLHEYSSIGSYTIKISWNSGTTPSLVSASSVPGVFVASNASGRRMYNTYYSSCVKNIRIGSGMNIGQYGCSCCYTLETITIPSGTSIGTYAFYSCNYLKAITIPNTITSIPSYAFSGCYAVKVSLPSTITTINDYAFNYYAKMKHHPIISNVTSFGNGVFANCRSIVKVKIPSAITILGSNVVDNCYSLRDVNIPSGTTSIGTYFAQSDFSLGPVVTIPSGVTSIGTYAFSSCNSVIEFHILAASPPTLGSSVFGNIQSYTTIYVPYSADHSVLNAYQTATNWSSYASYIQEEPQ